jgi:hypothetical protein
MEMSMEGMVEKGANDIVYLKISQRLSGGN